MKMPIKCPVCNKIMLKTFTKFKLANSVSPVCKKTCNHNDYEISLYSLEDNYWGEVICRASILYKNTTFGNGTILAIWDFGVLQMSFLIEENEERAKRLSLPWFEPDLSNPKKLLNKIKTYIVFS